MPQPCPQTSADHAMRTRRPAVAAGAEVSARPGCCPHVAGDVFEVDAIEDVLARAQQANLGVRVEAGLRRRDGAAYPASVGKIRSRRVLDDEARWPIDVRPHDGAIGT